MTLRKALGVVDRIRGRQKVNDTHLYDAEVCLQDALEDVRRLKQYRLQRNLRYDWLEPVLGPVTASDHSA